MPSQSKACPQSADRQNGSQSDCVPSSRAGRASSPREASRRTDMNKPLRLWNDYDRPHSDLREAIDRMERAGELLRIRGADWKLEMGTLAEIVYRQDNPPAIQFEDIPGYPGCRAVSGLTNSARRMAITLGFAVPSHPLDVVRAYRDRMKLHKPIPPRVVKDGPVLENVLTGKNLDVLKFPAPLLHEHDGGRGISEHQDFFQS